MIPTCNHSVLELTFLTDWLTLFEVDAASCEHFKEGGLVLNAAGYEGICEGSHVVCEALIILCRVFQLLYQGFEHILTSLTFLLLWSSNQNTKREMEKYSLLG